jgi:hypothetical protein
MARILFSAQYCGAGEVYLLPVYEIKMLKKFIKLSEAGHAVVGILETDRRRRQGFKTHTGMVP